MHGRSRQLRLVPKHQLEHRCGHLIRKQSPLPFDLAIACLGSYLQLQETSEHLGLVGGDGSSAADGQLSHAAISPSIPNPYKYTHSPPLFICNNKMK